MAPNGYNLTTGGGQGTVVSEETRQKQSEVRKGKKLPPHSEEARRKISEARKGKKMGPHSEEARSKMSEAWKRRPPASDETRRKISEANNRRWEKKREAASDSALDVSNGVLDFVQPPHHDVDTFFE
jgi:hypothetical protein